MGHGKPAMKMGNGNAASSRFLYQVKLMASFGRVSALTSCESTAIGLNKMKP